VGEKEDERENCKKLEVVGQEDKEKEVGENRRQWNEKGKVKKIAP
jgi:hypothetical protein